MKIILLTGKPRSQKTATLNLVYNQLIQGMANPPPLQPISYGSKHDFECVLPYKNKQVAIYTLGDTLYHLIEAIIKYSYVDVLILAHSQGGATKNKFATDIAGFSHHYVLHKTNKNTNDCLNIINHI